MNKKKWFDTDCTMAKRATQMKLKERSTTTHSTKSIETSSQLLLKPKEYRAMKRSKKGNCLYESNKKINGLHGSDWNWNALKQLSVSDEHSHK